MKKLTLITSLMLSAALTACGGGGGGTTAAAPAAAPAAPTAAPASPTGQVAAPVITVAQQAAQVLTAADCPRLASDALSAAAVDLANPTLRSINELLLAVDPDHGHKVFIRRPNDFANWVILASGGTNRLDIMSLGTAVHETNHMVDTALAACAPVNQHKLQFFGQQLVTDLTPGSTPSYGIADTVMPAALKSANRYSVYITGLGLQPGNDFRVLLDELAAYVGAAHTELKYANTYDTSSTGSLDTNLGGMVNFMVYVQAYLQAARVNNNAQWITIRNSAVTKLALQAVWSRAEQVLTEAYPKTVASSNPRFVVDTAYLAQAYSAGFLAELDQLGITHGTAASFSGTYLP
jgi:hypothetical protein